MNQQQTSPTKDIYDLDSQFSYVFTEDDKKVLSVLKPEQVESWIAYFKTHSTIEWKKDGKINRSKELDEFGSFFLQFLGDEDQHMKYLHSVFESKFSTLKAYRHHLGSFLSPFFMAQYIGSTYEFEDVNDPVTYFFISGLEDDFFLTCSLRLRDFLLLQRAKACEEEGEKQEESQPQKD